MQADGDQRPIDHIRLDLFRDLLRGIPLPDATRHLITDAPGQTDHTEADHTGQPDRRPSRGTVSHHMADDVIAEAERQIAQVLAEIADEELSRVLDRVQVNGRLDRLPMVIGHAAEAMRASLDPIIDAWCGTADQTTANHTTTDQHGHHGYRPPAAMQRLIRRRHPVCVFPTCNRRSVHCDLDHTVPFDKGGPTCRCNLAPLCRTHHRIFKQHRKWRLIQIWPGLLIWVAPSGTWHIVVPQ